MVDCPSTTSIAPSAPASGSGRSEPPPGSTSMMYCENVSAKPDSGRAMIQARDFSQFGSRLATMSLIVPLGMMA